MPHVDYYFSLLSAWAYLADDRMEAAAARHGATVTYKPFDIMALFPRTGGVKPAERHPSRMEYRAMDLARQARRRGMALNPRPAHWPTNPAPASYAIIAAQAQAGGGTPEVGALVRSLLRATWAEERDVADAGVIADCLAGAGFAPGLADSGLLQGAETYAANLEDAVAAGVFGSPFYVTNDGERFWGQDRVEDLDIHLGALAAGE